MLTPRRAPNLAAGLRGTFATSGPSRPRMLTTRRARNLLAGVRGTFGTMALVAPRPVGRAFGIDADAQPAAVHLTRLLGVRDVLLCHQLVSARDDDDAEEALRGGICVDAVDTVSALLGLATGDLSRRASLMGAAAAAGAAALGMAARGPLDAEAAGG